MSDGAQLIDVRDVVERPNCVGPIALCVCVEDPDPFDEESVILRLEVNYSKASILLKRTCFFPN